MDINELIKYENMWVAYSSDRKLVKEKSKTLKSLLKKIKDKDLIISFIPRSDVTVSP